jgi:hypothetical protein
MSHALIFVLGLLCGTCLSAFIALAILLTRGAQELTEWDRQKNAVPARMARMGAREVK